jgi:uncharacterized protein YvpB
MQSRAQVLHFACSVLSTVGIVVMALLVREIINQLELILSQDCEIVSGMILKYHA